MRNEDAGRLSGSPQVREVRQWLRVIIILSTEFPGGRFDGGVFFVVAVVQLVVS